MRGWLPRRRKPIKAFWFKSSPSSILSGAGITRQVFPASTRSTSLHSTHGPPCAAGRTRARLGRESMLVFFIASHDEETIKQLLSLDAETEHPLQPYRRCALCRGRWTTAQPATAGLQLLLCCRSCCAVEHCDLPCGRQSEVGHWGHREHAICDSGRRVRRTHPTAILRPTSTVLCVL